MSGLEDLNAWAKAQSDQWNQKWRRDRELVNACLSIESGLAEHEVEFIDRMSLWLQGKDVKTDDDMAARELRLLTQRQREWLYTLAKRHDV